MYIITGGGTGIGKALAQALASRGKKVLVVGRRQALLEETVGLHANLDFFVADVATAEGRQVLVDHLKDIDQIAGLIHNAGTIEPMVPLLEMKLLSFQHLMATNLEAPLFLTQALAEKLHQGRVLHIGSGAAYFPVAGWSAYCISKAALSMLTRAWQLELPTLALSSVMPGIIDTDMQALIRAAKHMHQDKLDFFKRLKEDNLLIEPQTVGAFLTWLLLDVDASAYSAKEWDIYDTSHHQLWLKPPHVVPVWD